MLNLLKLKPTELPLILECIYTSLKSDMALATELNYALNVEQAINYCDLDKISRYAFFVWSGIRQQILADLDFWPANLLAPQEIQWLLQLLEYDSVDPVEAILAYKRLNKYLDTRSKAESTKILQDFHRLGVYAIKRAILEKKPTFWLP